MKRISALLTALGLMLAMHASGGAEKVLTISFAGDCTLGSEEAVRENTDSFDTMVREKGYSYFFAGFQDLFSSDDCTVVNCECVFSDDSRGENTGKSFRFRGPEHFVNILREGSVEAVSLANNHTQDYGIAGLENTKRVLEEAGIGWAWDEWLWILEKDGIRVAFASIDFGIYRRSNYLIRDKLLQMREEGTINAAVLLVHEGKEYAPQHSPWQDEYAEYFIREAKVDLVIGHHPHVLQGIRILQNRPVFYSLGNFVFGGHNQVSRGDRTNSLYTMAVQVKMYFTDSGEYKGQQALLYPAYDSGTDPLNNYQPVRVSAEEAVPVLQAIQADTEWTLPEIRTDESGKAFVVLDYLPAEEEPAGAPDETGEPEKPGPRPDRKNK